MNPDELRAEHDGVRLVEWELWPGQIHLGKAVAALPALLAIVKAARALRITYSATPGKDGHWGDLAAALDDLDSL